MSYSTIVSMASDQALLDRCVAAAAQEGERDPRIWAQDNIWHLAASQEWVDAWAYAVNTGNTTPGGHSGVINDNMILAAVQARRTALAAPPA